MIIQEEPGYTRPVWGRPFLKWAGGKSQLLPHLLPMVPKSFGTYYEPFLGGGAVFFALQPKRAVLNDANELLIMTYRAVRDDASGVVSLLRRKETLYNSMSAAEKLKFYLGNRAALGTGFKDSKSWSHDAARVLFLNKTCFNGLWRVNKAGRFNVPMGKFKTPPLICNEDRLHECSKALQFAKLMYTDFESALLDVKKGDFVYCDPPYLPLSDTSDFKAYHKAGWSPEEQKRLYRIALAAKQRGAYVLISSASDPISKAVFDIDKNFEAIEVDAKRHINSVGSGRGAVKELIIKSRNW